MVDNLIRHLRPEDKPEWLRMRHLLWPGHTDAALLAEKQAGGELYTRLRCHNKRRKRYGSYDRRGKLPKRVSIEARPPIVE